MRKLSITTDLETGETIYFDLTDQNRFSIYVETGDLIPKESLTFNDWPVAHKIYEDMRFQHKYKTTEYSALHNEILTNGGLARF